MFAYVTIFHQAGQLQESGKRGFGEKYVSCSALNITLFICWRAALLEDYIDK